MAKRLSLTERDIFCTERPDLCSAKTRDLYHDGIVTMSRALGFPVMAFIKTNGEVLLLNVTKEYPDGVREDLPAPPGLFAELWAQTKRVVAAITALIIWAGILFIIFVLWNTGILEGLGKRLEK